MLGFDLASSYHNPKETLITAANAGSLKQSWEVALSGGVTGAPAVVGSAVYAVAANSVYALDAGTGKVRWQNPDVGGSSSPTFADGVLYVNASTGGELLTAIDAKTGKTRWQVLVDGHPNAAGISSPVVVEDYVIVGNSSFEEASKADHATFRGAVIAFHRTDGTVAWRFDTVTPPENGCAVWSTVSVDLDARRVFAATGNNYTETAGSTSDSIFALELDTGKLVWHRQASAGDIYTVLTPQSPDSDFGANPILYEAVVEGGTRKLLGIGQKSGVFWSLDRMTGDVVWQRALGPGTAVGGILNNGAYDGTRLLVASSNATSSAPGSEPANGDGGTSVLFALDPANGDIFWERQLPADVWGPITVANGVGFVGIDRRLEAFDVETGDKLLDFPVVGTVASTPVVANGRVYFGSGMQFVIGHPDDKLHALSLGG
jgi:polyvinyl alcohol dehydrogenase (cytochrome)